MSAPADAARIGADLHVHAAKAPGIELGRIVTVAEAPSGTMWGSAYFPQVANMAVARSSGNTLGGALQSLSLETRRAWLRGSRAELDEQIAAATWAGDAAAGDADDVTMARVPRHDHGHRA